MAARRINEAWLAKLRANKTLAGQAHVPDLLRHIDWLVEQLHGPLPGGPLSAQELMDIFAAQDDPAGYWSGAAQAQKVKALQHHIGWLNGVIRDLAQDNLSPVAAYQAGHAAGVLAGLQKAVDWLDELNLVEPDLSWKPNGPPEAIRELIDDLQSQESTDDLA